MKNVLHLLGCAAAIAALGACAKNNNGNGSGSAAAANDTVTITQASPPPGGSWADVVNATSAGGVMMGNPNAKVKLLEIGSLSCPHCKLFEDEALPALVDNYVKSGKVSWEFRPYLIHGAVDITADLIARCNGIKGFFPLSQGLYKDQATWIGKLEAAPPQHVQDIQNLPPDQAFVQLASLLGLQDWAAMRGIPQAKSNQCLRDQEAIDREVQVMSDVQSQYPEFTGTPAFVINGKMLPKVASWDSLKPSLDAAVKG